MPSREGSLKSQLSGRYAGAMLGMAIADALAFPLEGASRVYLNAFAKTAAGAFARHRSGYYPIGQNSDEVLLSFATIHSVVDKRRYDPTALVEKWVQAWRENRLMRPNSSSAVALARLASGAPVVQPRTADRNGRVAPGGFAAVVRTLLLGLWHFDDAEALRAAARFAARLTHDDEESVACSVAMATAIAFNLTHQELVFGEFLDDITRACADDSSRVAAAIARLPSLLALREEDAVAAIDESCRAAGALDPDNSALIGTMMALVCFLRSPGDYLAVVRDCLRMGGSLALRASVAGALSGTFVKVGGLSGHLVATLPARRGILQLADALYRLKLGLSR